MLWNLVKMVYKTLPPRPKTVNNFTSQTSNQSSSNLSGITRGGSFGTAGLANNSNSKIGSKENISTDENLVEEIASLSIAKMTTPDYEVRNLNAKNAANLQNYILGRSLRRKPHKSRNRQQKSSQWISLHGTSRQLRQRLSNVLVIAHQQRTDASTLSKQSNGDERADWKLATARQHATLNFGDLWRRFCANVEAFSGKNDVYSSS